MKARIFGDGPAGWLAGLVLANLGWDVCLTSSIHLFGRSAAHASQNAHIHIINSDIINIAETFDPPLAALLKRVARDDWHWKMFEPDSTSFQTIVGFRVSRPDVVNAIKSRALAAGVKALDDSSSTSEKIPDGDLVIDATGASRRLLMDADRKNEIELTIDEIGSIENYQTWAWELEDEGGMSALLKQRTTQGKDEHCYFEHEHKMARLTKISTTGDKHEDFPKNTMALICPEALPPKPPRKSQQFALPVRRALISPTSSSTPPLIAFGDSLIHTSPRQGFGMTSLFHQAELLDRAVREDNAVDDLHLALEDFSENLWLGASIAHMSAGHASL